MTDAINQPPEKINELAITRVPGQDDDITAAAVIYGPEVGAAAVAAQWSQIHAGGELPLMATVKALQTAAAKVNAGDTTAIEARLLAQATALDVLFVEMSRRAALNIGNNPAAFDRYLKLSLKAQNQSRMTLETLANVKNPPVVYAKQANINNGGQQQVNNGTLPRAPATENQNPPNKLLEVSNETQLDGGTASSTGGSNSELAAVVPLDRSKVA